MVRKGSSVRVRCWAWLESTALELGLELPHVVAETGSGGRTLPDDPCARRLPDTSQPPRRLNMCPLRSSVTEAPHSRRQSVRVGLAGRTGAKSDLEICEGVPAAVAVLVEAGSVERATRDFVDRFELRDGSLS